MINKNIIEKGYYFYFSNRYVLGASTVKRTTPNPYLVLSESGSILCINFEFVKNNLIHFKNMLIYKAEQFMMIIFLKKIQDNLEDGVSGVTGVQVGDMNKWLSRIYLK